MLRMADRTTGAIIGALALALVAVLAGLVDAGPLDPGGPPGSTPGVRLPGTPISGPTTITQPGRYYLTNDVGSKLVGGIVIDADHVTLDLNGFAVRNVLSCLVSDIATGIVVVASRFDVAVKNGRVYGWCRDGISALNSDAATATDLIVSLNGAVGLSVGQGSIVARVSAYDNGSHGVYARPGSTLSDVTAARNDGNGIVMFNSTVAGCSSYDNVGAGVHASYSTVEGCTITSKFGSPALELFRGSFALKNLVHASSSATGILSITYGNRIEGNHVTTFDASAIAISANDADNIIVANTLYGPSVAVTIVAGNTVGPFVLGTDPIATTNPWANFYAQP